MQHLDFWLQSLSVGDDGANITGIAATFEERATEGSLFKFGAFQTTLAAHAARGTLPAMLFDHNPAAPVGRWTTIRETQAGLAVEGRVSDATERARETRALLRDGALTGLSVGFLVAKGGATCDADGLRTITAADLHEISLVSTPALAGARVREVRTFSTPREAEDALRDAGFSKADARAFMAKGWRGLSGDDGPSTDDILAAIKRVEAATLTLKG